MPQVLSRDEMRSLPHRLCSQYDITIERLVRSSRLTAAAQLRPDGSGIPHRVGIVRNIDACTYYLVEIFDLPGSAFADQLPSRLIVTDLRNRNLVSCLRPLQHRLSQALCPQSAARMGQQPEQSRVEKNQHCSRNASRLLRNSASCRSRSGSSSSPYSSIHCLKQANHFCVNIMFDNVQSRHLSFLLQVQ